jgi:hypothetical protein
MVKEYRFWKRLKSGKVLIGSWHNDLTQAIRAWADCIEADSNVVETGYEVREESEDDYADRLVSQRWKSSH